MIRHTRFVRTALYREPMVLEPTPLHLEFKPRLRGVIHQYSAWVSTVAATGLIVGAALLKGAGALEQCGADDETGGGDRRHPRRVLVDHAAQPRLELQVQRCRFKDHGFTV